MSAVTVEDLDACVRHAYERHQTVLSPRHRVVPPTWACWALDWLEGRDRSLDAAKRAYDITEDLVCAECAAAALAVIAFLEADELAEGVERSRRMDFARRACALARGVVV